MASNFEKIMNACLESKKATKKQPNKTIKRTISESKKVQKRRALRESEETDIEDTPDDVVDDVADDIMVVVDPDMSEDDISDAASDAQDIIDSTPDGEVPSTDEYIGDYTYTCPICGNTFFSEVEMADGDECPVCGETPNGYVLVGSVADADDTEDEMSDEDLVPEDAVEDAEDLEPADAEESFKRTRARSTKRESRTYSRYSLDESTFNPFLNKFIKENYKNAKSFEITGATLRNNRLSLECKLAFKSGKSKNVKLTVENFKPARKMTLAAREDGTFKLESSKAKVAPFVFESIMSGRVVKCTGLKYNFITKLKEGKRAQVSGKLIRESRTRR